MDRTGHASYDLTGVGSTWTASLAFGQPVGGPLGLDAGASVLRYGSGDITRTLVIPEIGLSASIPLSDLSLLISAGGGVSLTAQGPGETQGTFFTSVALDIPTGGALSLRPAGRIRWVGPWAGTVADLTVGISYRLGRGRRADR